VQQQLSQTGETSNTLQQPEPTTPHGQSVENGLGLTILEGLPGWGVTLVTLSIVAAIILAGVYFIRPIFRFIHATGLREMYTALALLIVIGISVLMTIVGLSPALGAFLAGVVLANSEFRHELESDIEPFKGLLLGLFFITVGADMNLSVLQHDPIGILTLAVLVIIAKGFVLYLLCYLFDIHGRDRWLFTLGLAQAGEFGFVLTAFAVQQNILPQTLSDRLILIITLTMLMTPLLFLAFGALSRRLKDKIDIGIEDEINAQGPVIIAGIGRFGQIVNRLVQSSGFETVVLDHDIRKIDLMRSFGIKSFLGDPTRPVTLRAAGLLEAQVLVVALDDAAACIKLVKLAHRARPGLHIIARAYDRAQVFELYNAGADDIVRETFDSSLRAGRYVLENLGLSDYEADTAAKTFYQHDREAMRDLAQLWDPKIPAHANAAYMARAQALEKHLEAALMSSLENSRPTHPQSVKASNTEAAPSKPDPTILKDE
jgi:CPA2 family monovalent cation:H+ antiporter-2